MGEVAEARGEHVAAHSLIGRNDELARLRSALEGDTAPGCVIAGPDGVGKSHLAMHWFAHAEAEGRRGARVLATHAAAAIPFGALATVVPECGDGPSAFTAVRDAFVDLAGGEPFVLLIDDAHHLDDPSAALVLELVNEGIVAPLCTVQSGAACPDAVTALWKDLGAIRIELEPLDATGVGAVLGDLLGGEVPEPVARRFAEVAGGQPLMVRELAISAIEKGHLIDSDGRWQLIDEPEVSQNLAEIINIRLDRLEADERELLALLALCEPLPVSVVENLGLTAEFDALERRGLIVVHDPKTFAVTGMTLRRDPWMSGFIVRVAHRCYADVVVGRLSERRRRELYAAAAGAIEAVDSDGRAIMRSTLWRHWSGEQLDTNRLLDSARECYRSGDYQRCGELAEAAWRLAPNFAAGHLLGFALGRAGRSEEAEGILAATEELATGDRELTLVTVTRSENRFRGLADNAGSEALCLAAEERITDGRLRSEVAAHRAMGVTRRGAIDEAVALLDPLLDLDEWGARVFVKAAYAAGIAFVHAGRAVDAAAIAVRALPVHQEVWAADLFQTEPSVHQLASMYAMIATGRLAEAAPLLDFARDATRDALPRYGHAWVGYLSGAASLRQGHMLEALDHFMVATPIFVESRDFGPASWCESGAATAAALRGDIERAKAHLDKAETLGPPGRHLNAASLAEARAWLASGQGRDEQARRLIGSEADRALESGDRYGASHLLVALARCGAADRALESLEALGEVMQGELITLQIEFARLLANPDDPEAAIGLADRFADRGMELEAAEAMTVAARALRRGDQARAADRAATAARKLLDRCQGARTPLTFDPGEVVQLTERELEIARLVADRLPSKEIARQLNISPRTVDNHLHRVYGKLGVHDRISLAEVMVDRDL